MTTRHLRGMTLIEVLIVLAIIGLVTGAVGALSIQASKLYARTSWHIEPQSSAMVAFKRLERELRDAMLVSTTTPSPSTWIEVVLPKKDQHGLNILKANAQGRLTLLAGESVCYFLGKKVAQDGANSLLWTAQPDAQGTTLFRARSDDYDEAGMQFAHSRVLIDDIVDPRTITEEPSLQQMAVNRTLFVFIPYNDNGTPDDPTDDFPRPDTQLIAVTLIVKSTYQGRTVYHPLSTQFCLRNLHS